MHVALWIVQVVLALAFLGAGLMKLARTREALVAGGMGWAENVNQNLIRIIGVAEVLAAIGLVLPALTTIAPVLVPIAATGLALTMVGAVLVHLQRKDPPAQMLPALVLGVLAVVVAIGRFGAYSF